MRIKRHGWRCRTYILNRRLHHGTFGAALIAIGAALMYHDRYDCWEWFTFLREKDELW